MEISAPFPKDDELAAALISNLFFDGRSIDDLVEYCPVKLTDWDPYEDLFELEFSKPILALNICLLIARASSDAWVLCLLGCGPIETLLAKDPTLLDAIEIESNSSPGLREALRHVWQQDMPDDVYARVKRLASS